jgi:hypothetical protein
MLEHAHRLIVPRRRSPLITCAELRDERLDEGGRSSFAFAERRLAGSRKTFKTPLETNLAQLAARDGFGRIDVGGRDTRTSIRVLLQPAEPPERFRSCSTALQLHLRSRRHLADLIEEERPAIREFEQTRSRSPAPVNAPFSWPKISLSSSVSGIAAQLIAQTESRLAG